MHRRLELLLMWKVLRDFLAPAAARIFPDDRIYRSLFLHGFQLGTPHDCRPKRIASGMKTPSNRGMATGLRVR